MTNDLPDALIEKVARAIHDKRLPHGNWDEYKKSNPTHRYTEQAKAALQALDLAGIIDDLRFYGDRENHRKGIP